MAAVEVLISVHGSHKRWTSGYEGIDNLALRRLLVEINFAARSIEFELSAREIEPSTGSTTNGTSEGTLVKSSYLKSQRAKETIIRRGNELRGIYEKLQNTANKIKKNGLSDFAVVPGSQRAQLFITILHDMMENAVIPSHDNWSSNTHSAMLWMVLKHAGPAHMLLILHSISQRQFRKLGVHAAAKIVQHVVQNRSTLFCAPLEKQFRDLSSDLDRCQKKRKRADSNPQGEFDVQQQSHINSSDKEQRHFFSSYTEAESHETTMVEDDNGLEENNHLGLTCSQESNNIHQAFESQKGMVVAATCDATSAMLQPNTLQVGNDNYQLHRLHEQSHLNPSSVYISESTRSPPFAFPCGLATTPCTGILIEDTFNRNSTLIFERPYESAIFAVVQDGDIPALMALLRSGNASIHDVDPYGLGLLYYASYYCWKAHGPDRAMHICSWLVSIGVNTQWIDDIGNSPMESMLDSALICTAMSGGSALEFGKFCEDIGVVFNLTLSESGTQYLNTRGFTELHQVLLRINQEVSLGDYLNSLERNDLDTLINCIDIRGRTPLMWAVEFGWSGATQILLDYGADPHRATTTKRGSSTLLHLAVAGPRSQFSRAGFLEVIELLLQRGVDVNAKDHEGWTPLHIAASWGTCDLRSLFRHPALDWSVLTDDNMSVDALSPVEQFSIFTLARIYQS